MALAASRAGPSKPPVVQPGTGNNIIINPCQRLNPVLECIRNVGKEFGDILPDFQVGRTTGVLFLSLRYHRLHPEYVHQRIEQLGSSYNLRILLLMCDISEHQEHIRELTKICLINNITIIVAWTPDEAGQYLATYKQFEHKPPTLIRERIERTPIAIMRATLTGISKVNKTDVETLRTSFGSFANIARATTDQLSQLPGFGPKKVTRMKDAFDRPFRNGATSALTFPITSSQTTSQAAPEVSVTGSSRVTTLETLRLQKGKGKTRARETAEEEIEGSPRLSSSLLDVTAEPAHTPPSPVWDIELDLNSPSPSPSDGPPPRRTVSGTKRPREESPVWDIELDLNEEEVEEAARDLKRRKE